MEVNFGDSLKPNTTYTVTIGSDVVDLNNKNPMAAAVNFAFSTGDKIDKGKIKGKVYTEKPQGVILSAYKLSDIDFNPTEDKPDYRSQAGTNGNYTFLGLAPGTYRVFALRDAFKDFVYNSEEDGYGAPFEDVTLSEKDSLFNGLNFQLTREDTTKPNLVNLTMTDRYHLLVEFSEFVDSTKLSTNNFIIYDSTASASYPIRYIFKGKAKPKNYYLAIEDSLNPENENYLISKNIVDLNGNEEEFQATLIAVSTEQDTSAPAIKDIEAEFRSRTVDFRMPWLIINLDDGINTAEVGNAITVIDEKENSLPIKVETIDDASFRVNINSILEPRKEYKINFDLNYFIDLAGNKLDSIHTVTFKTFNDLEFTGASGIVRVDSEKKAIIILSSTDDKKLQYKQPVSENNKFNFERVLGGKYLLWSFIDTDSNGVYTYGKVYPFEPAERFVYYPDTLNLRPRWPVGDIILEYPAN